MSFGSSQDLGWSPMDVDGPSYRDGPPLNTQQSTESVSDGFMGLRPSTAKAADVGPWIFAQNQHLPSSHSASGEATAVLQQRGIQILREFEREKSRLESEYTASGLNSTVDLASKLNVMRQTLQQYISALARETGVMTGKWMLFPSVDLVDQVWAAVARATSNGDLGISAKVATDDGSGDGRPRLICVYTYDYEDLQDVKRVLMKLRGMGLLEKEKGLIYYKCDAYTYLNILRDNPYGLRASLFTSRDVFIGKG
jgi:hypothetical protein